MTEHCFIVAYNYRVFRDYCRERGLSHAQAAQEGLIYATLPKLRDRGCVGGSDVKVKFIGEWADRADARQILNRLTALDAVNVDTGRPVAEMVTGALEAVAEAAREPARTLPALSRSMESLYGGSPGLTYQQVYERVTQGAYAGESAGNRVRRLVNESLANETVLHTFVPPMPEGCSPVYLLDGPRQDAIYPVPERFDVFMLPCLPEEFPLAHAWYVSGVEDAYEALRNQVLPSPAQYTIISTAACQVMASVGCHAYDPELCAVHIRLGLSGSTNDLSALINRAGQRILDALAPGWERLMPDRPQRPGQPGASQTGRYLTYGNDTPDSIYIYRLAMQARPADMPLPVFGLPRPVSVDPDDQANWPSPDRSSDYGLTCAHICGGDDHVCAARAATSIVFRIPSGGQRSMPVCGPCYQAETAALAADAAT